jgi:trehalose transport system substrate-binding protein
MSLGESEWPVMRQEIFPAFEKKTGLKIEAVQIEAADLPGIIEAMHQAGRMDLDLFAQDNMQLFLLYQKDLVEDLSSYEKDIPKAVHRSLIEAGKFEGRLLFMPYRPNVQITYYNENKFKKYGLKPPQNWDELYRVGQVFKRKEDVGRILFKAYGGAPTATQLYEWIVSAGGDPLVMNDAGCVKTFDFLKKLWPCLSPDSRRAKFDTSNEYLARDSAYLMQNWPFGINVLIKDYGKKEIRTYSGFSGPVREAHVIGGEVLGIPKGAKHKAEAREFIRYLESKEVQEKMVSRLGWPSIRADAYGQVEDWMKPHYASVRKALSKGIFRKNVPYWSAYEKYVNEAFIKIVMQGAPTKATLDEYHKKIANEKSVK